MHPESGLLEIDRKLEKWQWHYNCSTWRDGQFFDAVLFLLSNLVTGPSFMSVSPLVLELWQFPFISDWPEIRGYPRLNLAQYLETGASQEYQIWHESLY